MYEVSEDPSREVHAKFADYLQQQGIERQQRPTKRIVAALKLWLKGHQNGEGKIELPASKVALGQERDKEPTLYGGLDDTTDGKRNHGMAKNVRTQKLPSST